MLNNIRNFAKTKSAGVLVAILIVPFVLWGMGGTFSGGNQNNIAKINNENISTQDFQDFLTSSNVDVKEIRENIDNNSVEEILAELISIKLLSMEIKNIDLLITDRILNKKIKQNKNFLDEDKKFSRIKYEKFLLSSNMSAPEFEYRLRQNELKNNLFKYISGGLYSPLFLVNNTFKNQTKKITIDYFNLSNLYKKKESFTKQDIKKFIEENENILKEKIINFQYSKITPKNLIGLDEFTNLYFEKIDEIENEISSNVTFESITEKYNLESEIKENFKISKTEHLEGFFKKIYENEEIKKLALLEENDFYILYEITSSKRILPDIKNENFNNKIKKMLVNKSKYELNNDLITKISEKSFTQSDFERISNNNFNTIEINSIDDNKFFSSDSVKYLYTKSKNDFGLVSDENMNIYLAKIVEIFYKDISKNSNDFHLYKKQSNEKIRNSIYDTYDFYINNKYKVKINEKVLERVKNYFR